MLPSLLIWFCLSIAQFFFTKRSNVLTFKLKLEAKLRLSNTCFSMKRLNLSGTIMVISSCNLPLQKSVTNFSDAFKLGKFTTLIMPTY